MNGQESPTLLSLLANDKPEYQGPQPILDNYQQAMIASIKSQGEALMNQQINVILGDPSVKYTSPPDGRVQQGQDRRFHPPSDRPPERGRQNGNCDNLSVRSNNLLVHPPFPVSNNRGSKREEQPRRDTYVQRQHEPQGCARQASHPAPAQRMANSSCILDSGCAPKHIITFDLRYAFVPTSGVYSRKIQTAGPEITTLCQEGTIHLVVLGTRNQQVKLALTEVLMCQEASSNLFSLSTLVEQGYSAEFKQD
jgi:hypothetical protein